VIVGSIGGNTAVVIAAFDDKVCVNNITGTGFINSEIITKVGTSITSTISSAPVYREGSTYTDIRVKCNFTGDSIIEDYGILYEADSELYIEDVFHNEKNIDTLFADIYTTPSQDNDGVANLTVPLETAKTNLQFFTGSEGDTDRYPPYTSTEIIFENDSLTTSISKLDEALSIERGDNGRTAATLDAVGTLYISSYEKSYILSSYSGTSDTLVKIDRLSSGYEGQVIRISPASGHTITVQAGSYLKLAGGINFTLDDEYDVIQLECVSVTGNVWRAISQQSNG
jgi:hypothetical protein